MPRKLLSIAAVALLAPACTSSDGAKSDGPSFPADYASSYQEVRNCRQSSEHDLNRVRVLADPAALDAYRSRDREFPVGAVVLKEEYDVSDPTCSGPIKQWTVMQRLAKGSSAGTLDWRWEQVSSAREVVARDAPRCIGCHTGCTADAGGYENTCEVP